MTVWMPIFTFKTCKYCNIYDNIFQQTIKTPLSLFDNNMSIEETIFAVEDTVDQFILHFSIINRVYIIHTTFKIRCVQSKGDARKETLTRIACVVKETETIKVGFFTSCSVCVRANIPNTRTSDYLSKSNLKS